MTATEPIARGVFLVGGPEFSNPEDAAAFVIDFGGEAVMIDCGAGRSLKRISAKIEQAGVDPQAVSTLFLTHCHIDHIGGAPGFRELTGCKIMIHELDAGPFEQGDPIRTAADWYNTVFSPTSVDFHLRGDEGAFSFGDETLHWIHTPGHTPGSIVLWLDRDGQRILFGQDLHGPFLPSFASDIDQWRASIEKILALKADVLCEGHFGIFRPNDRVELYINKLKRQQNGL